MATRRTLTTASATPAEFQVTLSRLPYTPLQETAKGVLPVLLRSMGHILYVVGMLNETTYAMPEEEIQNELNHAASHLDASIVVTSNTLSTTAKDYILAYCTAVGHAKDSANQWTMDDRKRLLKDLANRAAGIAAFMDRECLGITSDPGTSL